jgi:hypothetical protein
MQEEGYVMNMPLAENPRECPMQAMGLRTWRSHRKCLGALLTEIFTQKRGKAKVSSTLPSGITGLVYSSLRRKIISKNFL